MEWIIQLGFELEIYQVEELAGMYWYVDFREESLSLILILIGTSVILHTQDYSTFNGYTLL